MRFRGIAVFVAAWTACGAAWANTLDDELARLLATHPRIDAARAEVLAAERAVEVALAEYYPTLNLNGDWGYEFVDSPARRAINDEAFGKSRSSADATLTQNIFDGFRTSAVHQTAELNHQVSRISLSQITQDVLLEGVTAYLDVIRRRELVGLAKSNESTIQQQLNLEDERVQRGSGITVDVLLAKSRLQASKERRVAFEGQLENAVTRYTQVFDGLPPVDRLNVPPLPTEQLPANLVEAVQTSLSDLPQVLAGNRNVDLADVQKDVARSEYYPTLDLVIQGRYEDDVSGVTGPRRDYSVLLQASWEIFSGFATRHGVAEATFRHKARLDDLMQTNRKAVEGVKLAWQNLITARERVALLDNAVSIASEVHESFKTLRDAGQATIFEVLDAQNEIFDAQINAANAAFDARVAVYRLLRAMGRLYSDNVISTAFLEPAASLTELSERLRFLDDSVPNMVLDENGKAATRPVSEAPVTEAPVTEAHNSAPKTPALDPAQVDAIDAMAIEPAPDLPPAPADAPAVRQAHMAEDSVSVRTPRASRNAPAMSRIEPVAMPTAPAPRTAAPSDERETVFIASDGTVLNDPNFQRAWSYE